MLHELPPHLDASLQEYLPETQNFPFGPELLLLWLSHSSIPAQDVAENWSSSTCQHLGGDAENREAAQLTISTLQPPRGNESWNMTAGTQGAAEGLVLLLQIMNWLQRTEWSCCLSNPVRERKSCGELATEPGTSAHPGRSRFPGNTWQECAGIQQMLNLTEQKKLVLLLLWRSFPKK